MNKAVNLIKRLILFFVGMSIIQFGVALFLLIYNKISWDMLRINEISVIIKRNISRSLIINSNLFFAETRRIIKYVIY